MTAPTAGPWTYDFPDDDHGRTYWMILGPDTSVIAEVVSDVEKSITGDVVEANARLIAAAPELLVLAQEAINWLREFEEHELSTDARDLARHAVAAINKAEGRS